MNTLLNIFKGRGLFAHQRILLFWLVALAALVAPWLWLSMPDRELTLDGRGTSIAPGHHEPRSPGQAAR